MAGDYKTPGVYIEEISSLPASISPVETAIPAFIGVTEFAEKPNGESLFDKPWKIRSLVDFERYYGGGPEHIDITVDLNGGDFSVNSVTLGKNYLLYDSVRLFYQNGGGDCYIVSFGSYGSPAISSLSVLDFTAATNLLLTVDEPTLILFPDAVLLDSETELGAVQQNALTLCNTMQDRFVIMDLLEEKAGGGWDWEDGKDAFRENVGTQFLKYGAAYTPWVNATLPYKGDIDFFIIEASVDGGASTPLSEQLAGFHAAAGYDTTTLDALDAANVEIGIIQPLIDLDYPTQFEAIITGGADDLVQLQAMATLVKTIAEDYFELLEGGSTPLTDTSLIGIHLAQLEAGGPMNAIITTLAGYDYGLNHASVVGAGSPYGTIGVIVSGTDFEGVLHPAVTYPVLPSFDYLITVAEDPSPYDPLRADLAAYVGAAEESFRQLVDDGQDLIQALYDEAVLIAEGIEATLLDEITVLSPIYAAIVTAIREQEAVLPPSGAIAGIYTTVDHSRGVWKAPANISLNAVASLSQKFSIDETDDLNVHAATGKSINAIRFFKGKGNLVYGARTLAGNDAEWRYVPVRRLFLMIEESIKKATEFVVFEPNNANTWQRTKAMIENFLTGLWREGALAGAKPNEAFFVNVGLGSTMTSQDILDGKLIIEIGIAAVRPAEFIILKFSHKLQTS